MHKLSNKSRIVIFLLLAGLVYIFSNLVDEYFLVTNGLKICYLVIGISSLILLTGYSGQVSLGQGAFLAIGAYAAALSQIHWQLPIVGTFAVAIIAASVAGAILGAAASRLSGPYLAGATIALAIGLPSLTNQFDFLGGANSGLDYYAPYPPESLAETIAPEKWTFWLFSVVTLVAIFWLQNVMRSRFGRIWKAVRSSDIAAELAGISVARTKILAFTLSAGLAGLAGALLGLSAQRVSQESFNLALSFSLLTGAVLSGVTTLGGVMIGAVTLVAIPEIIRSIVDRMGASTVVADNLPSLIVSALLIVTVIFVPNGPVERMRSKSKKVQSL